MNLKFGRFLGVSLICIGLLGCHRFLDEFDKTNTHLEGRLIAGSFPNKPEFLSGENFTIDIDPDPKQKKALIRAMSWKRETLFETELTLKSFGKLELRLPYESFPYVLKESSLNIHRFGLSRCYVGQSVQKVSLCLGGMDFSLTVSAPDGRTSLQLYGGLSSRTDLQLEEPRKIPLSAAIDQALNKNFQSLYDFEATVQAHNTSMANILNMLPHFRFGNAVGIATMAQPVLISSVGDWAPFLIPSRWTRVAEGVKQDFASRLGFQVAQANLAQQVQMLALILKHDQKRFEHIVQMKATVEQFLERIKESVVGLQDTPVVLSTLAYREALDLEESQMAAVVGNDRAAVSMALGFFNPRAVLDVEMDVPYLPIHENKVYDGDTLVRRALDASLELQQLRFVEDALGVKKVTLALSWFDPSGSPDTGLGFNLIPQMKNIASEIRQINLKAKMIRQQIHQTAQLIERTTARAKINMKEIHDTLVAEQGRLELHLKRINPNYVNEVKDLSLFEIGVNEALKSYQKILQLKMDQESMILNWELGQVREERLLFMQRSRLVSIR